MNRLYAVTVDDLWKADEERLRHHAQAVASELRRRQAPEQAIAEDLARSELWRVIQAALVLAASEEPEERRPTGRFQRRATDLIETEVRRHLDTAGGDRS